MQRRKPQRRCRARAVKSDGRKANCQSRKLTKHWSQQENREIASACQRSRTAGERPLYERPTERHCGGQTSNRAHAQPTLASESRFAGSAGMLSSTVRVSTATTPTGIPPSLVTHETNQNSFFYCYTNLPFCIKILKRDK